MITGHNTEFCHNHRVFHVQTEESGIANPKIETRVYVAGAVLDSRRSSYDDLLPDPDPAIIMARMDEQHKSVIQAVKDGAYDAAHRESTKTIDPPPISDRPLDEAILEFMEREGDVERLELVLEFPLDPVHDAPLRLEMWARLCNSWDPVVGANVTVKVAAGAKRSSVIMSGKTDADGRFFGEATLPPLQPEACSLVVICADETGTHGRDELRVPLRREAAEGESIPA